MSNTSTHLMVLYNTEGPPCHNLIYTVDHTFSYYSKKFICACLHLCVHVHSSEFRGRNIKHFKTLVEWQGD